MRNSLSYLHALLVVLALQSVFFSPQAAATLIYGTNYVLDTSTGLRWQSTLATAGQAGPQIPHNRVIGGGLRLAVQDEVEALFTGNFPQLAAVLNTLQATPLDVDVVRLIEALGGGLEITTIEIQGQPPWELPSYMVQGWIAAPGTRTSIDQPAFWAYVPLSIGYGSLILEFPPEPPFDDFAFLSSGPILAADREIAEGGPRGYFLVSAAVPTPGSALLFSLGLLLVGVGRKASAA